LSAALVKALTGNDTITARFLNENSFDFRAGFKFFVNTNHRPTVTDMTLFTSGRVKVIPFGRHFTEEERDEGLKSELAKPENLSGILNWCFEGLKLIEETGFEMPDAVRDATEDYRKNSDKVGHFLDEVMEVDSLAETPVIEVYNLYKLWCYNNGFPPDNMKNFKSSLSNIATVDRRRPRGSDRAASALSMLVGYRPKIDSECVPPCTGFL
jgi:putative DNA primase/helicase